MQQSPTAPIAETNGNGQDTAREAARRARGTRAQKMSSRQEQAYLSFHVHIDDVLADKALNFDKLRPESKSASCSMHAESSSFKILEIVERDADSNGTDSPSNDLFIQNKIDTSKCGDDVRVVGLFGDENNNRYQDDSHNYENKSSVNSRNESDSHDDGFEVFDEFAECGDDFITSDRVDFEPNGDIFDDSLLSTFKVIRQPIEDQILVRPFNIEDFEPCTSLLISSLNTFRSMSRVDAKKLLGNITVDQVIDAAPYTVVATVQGSSVIVGLAGARMVHDDSIGSLMELRSLVVRPSFRNQEIAKMMVSALAHLGYELRLEQMVHNPQKEHGDALASYLCNRLDFVPVKDSALNNLFPRRRLGAEVRPIFSLKDFAIKLVNAPINTFSSPLDQLLSTGFISH
ncbi:unnamed protein product [Caenorhabditis auriculariae]|uniref:N-acetyltransferase domain-containing protein n=1 Tax=Caenorhabditis auriculariae TaxID=2777116 RepID=A0A8S1H869_9PELO|nr:unnamed protein product [Caenorhabditis auriculariae]